MAFLKEGIREWEIIINPDLKFARAERWKKGIKRYWGYDPTNKKEKLIFVQYPKSRFTRADMERILPEYEDCKLCVVGQKFKYAKNDNKNIMMSIVDLLGKIPKLGKYVTNNRKLSEDMIMQILATVTRYPISMWTSPTGKRVLSFIIGVIGAPVAYKYIRNMNLKSEWTTFFSNFLSSSLEMNSDGSFGAQSDLKRMAKNLMKGNFGAMFNNTFADPATIKQELRRITRGMSFDNLFDFSGLKAGFDALFNRGGRLRKTEGTIPDQVPKLGSEIKTAGDYQYVGTADRFRDVSDFKRKGSFGSGFRSKRRLKESGNKLY